MGVVKCTACVQGGGGPDGDRPAEGERAERSHGDPQPEGTDSFRLEQPSQGGH